ncbi:MAG: glycine cleavage system aminomethyltransferase GcvT [Chitinophagaceae bacterium]|nr:glycine cleavage system aminomethyltransferase GcvT [Chitinophagaceae bacterium]
MELKKVTLHTVHEQLGAKMVPFAGFSMPLKYSSDIEEHTCVRNGVGIFDVSHMGEFLVEGEKALDLLQYITSNDVSKLKNGQAQYSYFPNDTGGIIDDILVYKHNDTKYMVVVNASNIEKDWKWICKQNHFGATVHNISDSLSLFAVQGPKACLCLQSITEIHLESIPYYHFAIGNIGGIEDVVISATGYTGAGGFELYVKNEYAAHLWNAILACGKTFHIQPIGLGARDTLRLEMGYCLYGNDIDETTSPIEAGLTWVTKFTKKFINDAFLLRQKERGVEKKLVGILMEERSIPRSHYEIYNLQNECIGTITSGCYSPTLQRGIAMGYVKNIFSKLDTEVFIKIREKFVRAKITKTPFLQMK